MDAQLIPLSSNQTIELRKLFTDNRYQSLLECIRAERDWLSVHASGDLVDFLYREEFDRRAMEGFKKASRLAVALEVLNEYANAEKQLCTLQLEP